MIPLLIFGLLLLLVIALMDSIIAFFLYVSINLYIVIVEILEKLKSYFKT